MHLHLGSTLLDILKWPQYRGGLISGVQIKGKVDGNYMFFQIAELTKNWAGKWDEGIQQMVEVSVSH